MGGGGGGGSQCSHPLPHPTHPPLYQILMRVGKWKNLESELGRVDKNVLLDEANVVRRAVRVADVVAPLPGPVAPGAEGGADAPVWLPGLVLALQQTNLANAHQELTGRIGLKMVGLKEREMAGQRTERKANS